MTPGSDEALLVKHKPEYIPWARFELLSGQRRHPRHLWNSERFLTQDEQHCGIQTPRMIWKLDKMYM